MANGYIPDTRQRIQRSTRFFARPLSFDLECPRCGRVYQIRMRESSDNWDPTTSRFRCTEPNCLKVYVIGLLAWPISSAVRKKDLATPEDQVPGPRELAQLRREGGGYWLADEAAQKHGRPHTTNLTTDTRPVRSDDPDDDEY